MKLGIATIALVVCSACLPGAASPTVQQRALARGAITALADAWSAVTNLCLDAENPPPAAATVLGIVKFPKGTCAKNLIPAHDALLEAANAVDTWDDASQHKFPCLVSDILNDVAAMSKLLSDVNVKVPQLVADALQLATSFAPQCTATPVQP